MPIKIKNTDWVEFKNVVFKMLHALSEEYDKILLPEDPDNFEIYVNDCEITPIFTKKQEYLKVEYDFSLCDIRIRLLSVYLYANVMRVDFSLKNENMEIAKGWQENQS